MSDTIEPICISTESMIVATDNSGPHFPADGSFVRRVAEQKGYWIEGDGHSDKNGAEERAWLQSKCSLTTVQCNGSVDKKLDTYLGLGNSIKAFTLCPVTLQTIDSVCKDKSLVSIKDCLSKILGPVLSEDNMDAFLFMCEQDQIQVMQPKKYLKDTVNQIVNLINAKDYVAHNLSRFAYFVEKRRRKMILTLAMREGGIFFMNKKSVEQFTAEI